MATPDHPTDSGPPAAGDAGDEAAALLAELQVLTADADRLSQQIAGELLDAEVRETPWRDLRSSLEQPPQDNSASGAGSVALPKEGFPATAARFSGRERERQSQEGAARLRRQARSLRAGLRRLKAGETTGTQWRAGLRAWGADLTQWINDSRAWGEQRKERPRGPREDGEYEPTA